MRSCKTINVHPALPAGSSSGGGAVWSFAISTPGWYSIQATWPTTLGLALTTVQYQITLAGVRSRSARSLSTRRTPQPASRMGPRLVQTHAGPRVPHARLLQVQLSDVQPISTETGNSVVADAVRLVENDVQCFRWKGRQD